MIEATLPDLLALQHPARHFSLDRLGLRRLVSTSGNTPRLRGRGMTFEEHRAYAAGDEPRFIDWRVTARTGDMHIKVFREEHERPVLLFADMRPTMHFGTRCQLKSTLAAQACALLAWTAAHGRERVGGVVLNTQLKDTRSRSGVHGVLPWLKLASQSAPAHTDSPHDAQDFPKALMHLRRTLRPGSIVVIASDFADLDKAGRQQIADIARHNQLILLSINDPLETEPPQQGQYPLKQQGQTVWVDFSQNTQRDHWISHFAARQHQVEKLADETRAALIPLLTSRPAQEQLAPWLTRR